ncbi:hypothetical protein GCK72_024960 [Caenorhabditis remanei]|uniref:Uncharacterized protein n=1 Tax=Caenorhabditis remanei TaxID=31234 RepID=A0A6A5G116_CAERE|nr:hypothetical protein GCK72_024960 [Caenorhabditis remanei]KAF1748493.1 hypothetical protein GCK72_024960 [Caenorhabditis remanei]
MTAVGPTINTNGLFVRNPNLPEIEPQAAHTSINPSTSASTSTTVTPVIPIGNNNPNNNNGEKSWLRRFVTLPLNLMKVCVGTKKEEPVPEE